MVEFCRLEIMTCRMLLALDASHVGVGAAAPVMSSLSSTGAQVQKRLVSP